MKPLFKTYEAEYKVFVDDAGAPTGKVQFYASVFNNVDLVGDRVMPGAFEDSLKAWRDSGDPIPVVFSHNWGDPFAIIGYADPFEVIEDSKGLLVTASLDIDTNPTALQAFKLMQRRIVKEASFSYDVELERKAKDDANNLVKLNILEVGPCLKGANPLTDTVSAKSRDIKSILQGSVEERQAAIGMAVAQKFGGGEDVWTYIEGTYSDRVVVCVTSMEGEKYFAVPYQVTPEGDVTLGAETEVELTTVVTKAEGEAAPGGANTGPAGTYVPADTPVPKGEAADAHEAKVDEPGDEAKAGRRNSAQDQAAIQSAHDALVTSGAVCAVPEEVPAETKDEVEVSAEVKDDGASEAAVRTEEETVAEDTEEKSIDYAKLAKDFAELGDVEGEIEALAKAAVQRAAKAAKSPPWHVEERDGKFVVVVDETSEVVGEHETREEAEAQVAALYANTDEGKASPSYRNGRSDDEEAAEHDDKPTDEDEEKSAPADGAKAAEDGPSDGGVVKPDEATVECPQCGGSGKVPDGDGEKTCPKCDGSGRIPKEPAAGSDDAVPGKSDKESEATNATDEDEVTDEDRDTDKSKDLAEYKARIADDIAAMEQV